jgi:adenosylcobinamide-GDP ribazoletransferase
LPRALSLLTRLPAPGADGMRMAASAWAWPVVGALVAGLAGLVGLGALALGLPAIVAAGLVLAAQVMLTGAMHEDGLADCADGIWGGMTRDRRLEILKDSRIGAYGVLALILCVGLRWGLIAALLPLPGALAALMAAGALSRGAMAGVMAALPFARTDGLARHVGRPTRAAAGLSAAVALAVGLVMATPATWGAAGAVVVASALFARLALGRLGGQTGDVLGATQQLGEIAALLVFVALAP